MSNSNNQVKQVSQGQAAILGFQHLLTMYSGDVITAIIIGTFLHLSAGQLTLLISTDIFMCGIATLLQLKKTVITGVGLPVVLGCGVQYITPLETIGKNFSLSVMYGSIIIAGLFVFLISGVFSKIRKFFPPVVTGSLITIIGFSIVPVAVQDWGGGNVHAASFGNPRNLSIGLITMLIIILINVFAKGFLRCIAILIGMIAGTGVASTMGMVSLKSVIKAGWFRLPRPFFLAVPHFTLSSSITIILVAITAMIESTGVFFALGDIVGHKVHSQDLGRGYRSEGLAAILGGIFNTFPYSTFSENVGVVQLSGIKTRRPIYYAAGFLLILGLFPKIAALFLIIPNCVLGGAMSTMFGMVGVQGIRVLKKVDFSHNNNDLIIVAVSIGLGLGITTYPQFFREMPQAIQIILDNGIVVTSIVAVILNILFNILPKKFGQKEEIND